MRLETRESQTPARRRKYTLPRSLSRVPVERAFTYGNLSAARLSAALARLLEGVELLGEALEHRRLRHLLDDRVRVRVRFRLT